MPAHSVSWLWRLLVLVGLTCLLAVDSHAQPATRAPGRIVVANLQGTVSAAPRDGGASRTLRNGDTVAVSEAVTTAPGASVVLVFSNGATVNLGSDSSLGIEEFLQEPFGGNFKVSSATAEPSSSTTRLHLVRGELVGNVKHLRLDHGSSFTVDTAVGAAGIRGTIFRIVMRADSAGKAVFSLSTDQGEVQLQGVGVPSVSVAAGREVQFSFEATIDPVTGEFTVTSPLAVETTTPISPETQAAVDAAKAAIVDAVKAIVVPPTGGGDSGRTGRNTAPGEKTFTGPKSNPVLPPNSPSE